MKMRLLLGGVLLVALHGAACVGSLVIAGRWAADALTKVIHGPPPSDFLVLVIVPSRIGTGGAPWAKIVHHRDLADFQRRHPDHSFLVPVEHADAVRTQLRHESPYYYATFRIEGAGEGYQDLNVEAPGSSDYDHQSWYRAHARDIEPRRHRRYLGPGMVMYSFKWAVPISMGLHAALWFFGWRRLLRRRVPPA